ncbi:MAG TPA: alpha/beta hydrolase, partial [Arachidicoccus sp.]
MVQQYLPFQNSHISYYRFGTGNKLIFAFHGYSNDAHVFDLLQPLLQNDYTFIAIDLPIHGGTRWRNGLFTTSKLKRIIDSIILQENLSKQYSLLGFSLGG